MIAQIKSFISSGAAKFAAIATIISLVLSAFYWVYDIGFNAGVNEGKALQLQQCTNAQNNLDNTVTEVTEVVDVIAEEAVLEDNKTEELDDAATKAIIETTLTTPTTEPKECFNTTEVDLMNSIISGDILDVVEEK